jgi:hypothetical protein
MEVINMLGVAKSILTHLRIIPAVIFTDPNNVFAVFNALSLLQWFNMKSTFNVPV